MAILLEATTVGGNTVWHSGNLDLNDYSTSDHDHGDAYIRAIENPVLGNFLTVNTDGNIESTSYNETSFSLEDHKHDTIYSKYAFSIIDPGEGEYINASNKGSILRIKQNTLGESNIEITSDPSTNTIYFKSLHPTITAATSTSNTTSFVKNVTLDANGHILNIESVDIGSIEGGLIVNSFNGLPIDTTIDSEYSNKVLGVNSTGTSWTFFNSLPEISVNDSYKRVMVNFDSTEYILSDYDVYSNIYLEFDDNGNLMPQEFGSEIGEIINPILHDVDPVADRGKVLRLNYDGTGFDLLPTTGIGDSHFMTNEDEDLTPLPYGAEFAYISPPPIMAGDFGKILRVSSDETGYELERLIPNFTVNDENKLVSIDNVNNSLKVAEFATESDLINSENLFRPISVSSLLSWPLKGIINITVGTTGDFSTVNSAINYLINRPRLSDCVANIILQNDFSLNEQIIVDKKDLSWITITASTEINISRISLTYGYNGIIYPAFAAVNNAKLPNINVLFNMDETGTDVGRTGIYCNNGSSCNILPNCGIKNAAHIAVAAYGNSNIQMKESIFTNSKGMGVFCSGSRITMDRAIITGATTFGIRSWNGGTIIAPEANCKRQETNTSDDITIGFSSIILCPNSFGGTNQTPNSITSHGVIIK